MKHTSGPWIPELFEGNIYVSTKKGSPSVAKIYGLTGGQREANARLIAAAPEMLECLIQIVKEQINGSDVYDIYEFLACYDKTGVMEIIEHITGQPIEEEWDELPC